MRAWVVFGVLVGVLVALLAAYFLPERDTLITRGVLAEELRRAAELAPLANDLKDLKK